MNDSITQPIEAQPEIRPVSDYLMPIPEEGDEEPSRFLADAAYLDKITHPLTPPPVYP